MPSLHSDTWGKTGNSDKLYSLWLQNHSGWHLQPWNLETLAPWKESYDKPKQRIKKHRYYFADKGLHNQTYVFFPVVMYGCESWTIKTAEHQKIYA